MLCWAFDHSQAKDNSLALQKFHILFSFPSGTRAKPLKCFRGVEILVLNQSVDKPWQARQGLELQDAVTSLALLYLHPHTLRASWKKAGRDLSSASQKFQPRAAILRGNGSFSLREIINLFEICQINPLCVLD